MYRRFHLIAFFLALLSACAPAAGSDAMAVSNATIVLPGGAAMSNMEGMQGMDANASLAGYLQIRNSTRVDDHLIGVTCDFAEAMLHETQMNGDVASMKEVMGIDIPAGATVELKRGGYHVMFMNVKQALKVGDQVNLTLQFEKAGNIMVGATVTDH